MTDTSSGPERCTSRWWRLFARIPTEVLSRESSVSLQRIFLVMSEIRSTSSCIRFRFFRSGPMIVNDEDGVYDIVRSVVARPLYTYNKSRLEHATIEAAIERRATRTLI